jgi:Mn2+/Fe2+ NRAMP family transporter
MKVPDEIAVALVTAACVIGLAIAFKNVFRVDPPVLFSINVPLYLFIVYLIARTTARPTERRLKHDTLLWSTVIFLVSVFTLLVYVA